MIRARFDMKSYLEALNAVREARGLTWYQFFKQTGIQRKNIRKSPSIHTIAILTAWSHLNPQDFIKQEEEIEGDVYL
jgi:hypothetical protein